MIIVQAGLYEFAKFIDRKVCRQNSSLKSMSVNYRLRQVVETASKEGFAELHPGRGHSAAVFQVAMFNDTIDEAYRPKLGPFRLLDVIPTSAAPDLTAAYSASVSARLDRYGEDDILDYLCKYGLHPVPKTPS